MSRFPGKGSAESIGVRTFAYEDAKRNRPVVVELWYPVDAEAPIGASAEDIYLHPKESRDAPMAASVKQRPLIIMSHGHRGDRRDRSWLSEQLVRANFVVASVEHYGNSYHTFNPILSLKYWERAGDISFALDQILSESFLAGKIDPQKIGFIGYSLGGMTGLALAGSTIDSFDEVLSKNKEILAGFPPEAVASVDFSQATARQYDPRIRAYLLIAPANFLYKKEALKKIRAPVGLVTAINDEVLPHSEHASPIIQHVAPVKLKILRKELSHSIFLNPVSELGKKLLPEKYHVDPTCCTRASIHKEVGTFVVDFFKEQL